MAQTMEDFESMTMNLMEKGTNGKMTVVPNPDPTGINLSSYVVKFIRPKDGKPWSGFYSTLSTPINLDTYRYVHVKVWKTRISKVKFKLEGPDIEIASMNTQTIVNGWQDMVFDFTAATGNYTKITFQPDAEDPLTLTEDITLYFDDLIINNDPNPATNPAQVINVDMHGSGLTTGQTVWLSGALGGIYGTWDQPGLNPNNEMLDPDGDSIYTATLSLPDGIVAMKFFKATGWGGGDNAPGGDRVLVINGNITVNYKYGNQGVISQTSEDRVIMENYESLKMNPMEKGTNGKLTVVPNPDPSGINKSGYVVEFVRPFDGKPWSGFYATLSTAVDFTVNKYVHAKVWKSRISPVKFKIEGPDIEIKSMNTQKIVNGWEDMVFDFSAATGNYTKITFQPDAEDPLTLTSDITIYFDDFILNNNPNQADTAKQTISVDMHGSGLTAGQRVFISGAIGDIHGTWVEAGLNLNNEMFDADGDSIYSIKMQLGNGVIAFKFFKGTGWGGGDPAPGGDRSYNVTGSANLLYKWNVQGQLFVSVGEKPLAGKVNIYPNPVRNELTVNSTAELRSATITSMLGKVVGKYTFNNAGTQSINTEGLKSGMYFVTFIGKDGSKVTQKLLKD